MTKTVAPAVNAKRSDVPVARLSPDDVSKLLAGGLGAMERYLLYGMVGVNDPAATDLPPSVWNWLQFGEPSEGSISSWTNSTFAGFYWSAVSTYRHDNGKSLTVPDWQKLESGIDAMRGQMSPWDLYLHIDMMKDYWDEICLAIGNAGKSMSLNELSVKHGLVRQVTDLWIAMDQIAFDATIRDLTGGNFHP